jgi:ATP-dependent DNA helicase Q1
MVLLRLNNFDIFNNSPDYKTLGVLKIQFPRTPLIALTATCPAFLLDSIMSILHMHPKKTLVLDIISNCVLRVLLNYVFVQVYSGSLNRPNLHFSVVSKPSSAQAAVRWIVNYINSEHAGERYN